MKTGKRVIIIALLLVSAAMMLINCGGGGGGSDTNTTNNNNNTNSQSITLSGSVGSGYQTAPHLASGVSTTKTVDQVVAIQSDHGYLAEYSMQNSVTAAIQTDGTFSITLDKTKDWLLVLVNSDPTVTLPDDRFAGYIALKADANNSLLQLPASTATTTLSNIDLGTVAANGDTAVSSNTITASDFSLTQQQLLTLANNDDSFKSVKNFVINYDKSTNIYYTLRPDFSWTGSYAIIGSQFQSASTYTYVSYQFQLDSNSTELTMDKICGTGGQTKVLVELYPPAGAVVTTASSTAFTDSNPLSSATVTCALAADGTWEAWTAPDGGFLAGEHYGKISESWGSGNLTGSIPPGYWLYKVDSVIKGQFDVAVASPLTASNTVKGFAPSIKVNYDAGTNQITSVDIQWSVWNGTSYDPVTDISILRYLIGSGDVYFDNNYNGTRTYESVHFDPSTQSSISPSTYTWYYGSSLQPNQLAQSIGIFYESGGIGYFFHFR